jgi:WD40 repeat protein/serine/threonine protein kinase
MAVLKKCSWLSCVALSLLLGCDQHNIAISPVQQGIITQEEESSHTPLHQVALQGGEGKTAGSPMSLVYLLFRWNYEDIGKKRILEHLSPRDKGHLRETCLEMGWMGFHKEAFHLNLTAERLQAMRLQDYPRLYPHHGQHVHCICPAFRPVPADAMVKNAHDLERIIQDKRFLVKSVVFKGKPKDLDAVRKALPDNLKESLLLPEAITVLSDGFEQSKELITQSSLVPYPVALDVSIGLIDVNREHTSSDPFVGANRIPQGEVKMEEEPFAAGAFGQVYKGTWKDRPVALKKVDFEYTKNNLKLTEDEISASLRWEISRLSTVTHPNIVQFYGVYEPANYTYLVMEFCEGGDLSKQLQKPAAILWKKRWQWALQITEALAYLHKEGILHRDLKAENVLLDRNGRAKLCDLGVAQVDAILEEKEPQVTTKGIHDFRFIAPENVNNIIHSSKATDIYALGLVLWEIGSGKEPRRVRDTGYFDAWAAGKHIEREPIPQDCPEDFKDLILDCWQTDPNKRPSAQALVDSLQVLGAAFDPYHHSLIKACEKLENVIHSRRKEGQSYIAPFVTEHRVDESIESYWNRVEPAIAKGEKAGNPPLELKETFKQFIEKPWSSTLLLLGEAGLGKTLTTYLWADELLLQWWAHMNTGGPAPAYFPIFIRPSVGQWTHEGIQKAFPKVVGEYAIPGPIAPLVFVDGYDELGGEKYKASLPSLVHQLGLSGYPHTKLIVTCRPNTVEVAELGTRFSFNGKLETRYFLPFKVDQLLTYLGKELSWDKKVYDEYEKKLAEVEAVRTVLRNPFVLYLLRSSWETVSKKPLHLLNRWQIYEGFTAHILTNQKTLLSKNLQALLKGDYTDLLTSYQAFASEVAMRAFNHKRITLSIEETKGLSAWVYLKEYAEEEARKEFSEKEKTKLKRRSLLSQEDYVLMMLKRVQQFEAELTTKVRGIDGDKRYEYSHKSLFEYFMAKRLVMLKDSDWIVKEGIRLLEKRPIQEEREALAFWEEGWGIEEVNRLKEPLFEIIKASRHDGSETQVQASANAATLLAAAHVPFSGRDLRGVRIKGADVSNGVFHHTCLYKADLQDVILHRVFLGNADLREANLQRTNFGEFSSLKFESSVRSVTYSQDGVQMAVGLENGHIALCKKGTQAYKHIKMLKGHSGWVRGVAYSPDDKQLASGGGDYGKGELYIWDTQTLQLVKRLKGHKDSINSVTYSPDGKQLASGSEDNTVKIWDTRTLQLVTQLKGHTREVYSVTYRLDGKQLASGSGDTTVGVWDAQTLQLVTQLKGHKSTVNSVTYRPDGKQLASGSEDNTVVIWDTQTLQPIKQLKGHSGGVNSVIYRPDGKQLASGSEDNTVVIWDTQTLQPVNQLKGHSDRVWSIMYSLDSKQLASGSIDHTVGIWDMQTFQSGTQLKGHSNCVRSVTYSPDGKRLASGGGPIFRDEDEGELYIWDTQTLQLVTQLKGHKDSILSVTYSPGGNQLASGSADYTVGIWDTETFQLVTQLKGHEKSVESVTYSPDGKQLASRSNEEIRIWDAQTLQLRTQLKGYKKSVYSVMYSPDGKQLAAESEDNTVVIWDTETFQLVKQLKGRSDSVDCVTYSPDGNQLASRSEDNTVGIWDMQTLQLVTQLKGHSSSVMSVAYSPDGNQLASGSADHAVFLWAKQSCTCLPGGQENWQLIRRFESGYRLSAEGTFLKGANISENNLELLKQKGANDDQAVPDHPHPSLVVQGKSKR